MNATGTPPLPAASPTAATAPTATGAPETPARLQRRELARLAILTGVVAIAACMVLAGVVAMAARCRRAAGLASRSPGSRRGPRSRSGSSPTTSAPSRACSCCSSSPESRPGAPDKRSARLGVRLGEVILAGAITANVAVVGAALGAYRERMVLALMPHGPVELAAYALAVALYLQDRRRNLPAGVRGQGRGGVRGVAGDRRRARDVGERMSPGRTLLQW